MFESVVDQLAKKHAAFGLRREDLDHGCNALIAAFKEALGGTFDPEAEAAWRWVFQRLANTMFGSASAPPLENA